MERLKQYFKKVRNKVGEAVREDHTPRETAISAAFGTFVVTLPTLGLGVLLFVLIAKLSERVNKVALFSCVVVFNPIMKYPVYLASYWIGSFVQRSEPPTETLDVALTTRAFDATQTMLLGNIILAFVLATVAYFVALEIATRHKDKVEELEKDIVGKF